MLGVLRCIALRAVQEEGIWPTGTLYPIMMATIEGTALK